jgi:large subunit ribosomal protein L13
LAGAQAEQLKDRGRTNPPRGRTSRTYNPKGSIETHWWLIDADRAVFGRLASEVARYLQGKHRPDYTPNRNMGDHVVVVNLSSIVITGDKMTEKQRYRHSGFPGGLRTESFGSAFEAAPDQVFRDAVRGMLPKTRLGNQMLNKLRVYGGADHPHSAQRPAPLDVDRARIPRIRTQHPRSSDAGSIKSELLADRDTPSEVEQLANPSRATFLREATLLLFPDAIDGGRAVQDSKALEMPPEEVHSRLRQLNSRLKRELEIKKKI